MFDQDPKTEPKTRQLYERAYRQATLRSLTNLIRHRCNDLIPADDVLNHINLETRNNLGVQQVPVDRILGSTGRYRDFDLAFFPLRKETRDRWINIANAHEQGVHLPPVLLYKVGDAYFVEDGNHRVSVARILGERYIEAQVIEIDASALDPEPSCQRLGFKSPEQAHHCK